MPGLFFPFSPLIMRIFVLWTTAMGLLIVFDLHRMRQQEQRSVWYERSVLWFAVCGISLGLALASSTLLVRGSLSDPLYWSLIFVPLLLFALSLFGGSILAMRPVYKKLSLHAEIRLRQQDESRLVPVAKSRPIENPTILMIGVAILLSLFALMDLVSFYTHLTLKQFIVGEGITLLAFLLLMLSRSLVLRRSIKRLNQRRIMFVIERRKSVVVKPIAPEPGQAPVPPLVLRLKWWVINCYLVLFVAVLFLFWLSLINVANSFPTSFFLLLIPVHLLFKLFLGLRERVEATTHGLGVHGWRSVQMPWQEARLFACYQMPDFFGGKTVMTYELASPSRVVQWTRVIDTHSLFTPWKTEVSTGEYNRQMRALCACITAQTGLELYDVSEERSTLQEQEMKMVQPHE